ncbi:glycoside hydrolase family 61 protein [Heterobasidion irregulare TC 32-1]|uniref:AA9 family lytic polysaccharide monooxygenase n=1 Tax=Heterobasidion irregulare (strain TC 32-1) TaxID=747525 RepID=W4K498_HETIT|nr:glycoside hydrolase family 61 protein [Heterobasidion irregulare TC 32-1]ETW79866.1 glycoside hydrolase family 61 protein [Heterobasidion irregulare TC 32-1]
MFFTAALVASLAASASAHATFQEMWVNGVDQGNYCVRLPASNSPVTSVTTNDLACNAGASPSSGLCAVNPGDSVTVEMHQQPGDRSCATEAIGGDHYGPINIYLAKVSDATTAVGSSASWFKISEMGLPSSDPDYWATEVLNDNCGHFTFTIPTGIAPGQYLLRAEVIALHVASSVGGAQFYMSCFQLNVGGSGTAQPSAVNIPGAYGASDPGILINIYQSLTAYTIPGPTPYGTTSPTVATTAWPTAATWNTADQPSTVPTAPAGSATAAPTSSAAAPSSSASAPASSAPGSSTAATPTSSAAGATQTKYGQCGGIGWSGPTACVSGSTCTSSGAYYSQCL